MRFAQCRRADQSIDEFIAEFDLLRRKQESKVGRGKRFPERFAPIFRTPNAGLPRQEKSLVMASSQRSLSFMDVAAKMRRLFGSRGGRGRQDVLVAEEADGPLVSEKDQEACVTKKQGVGQT